MKESHKGKQCIKIPFPRKCDPTICGILSCDHIEYEEGLPKEAREAIHDLLRIAHGTYNKQTKRT